MSVRPWFLLVATVPLAGCPSTPPNEPDAAFECSPERACPDDGVCLANRCYARCTPGSTSCGPLSMCSAEGACVPIPLPDTGSLDAARELMDATSTGDAGEVDAVNFDAPPEDAGPDAPRDAPGDAGRDAAADAPGDAPRDVGRG